jgi:hypothetical protein
VTLERILRSAAVLIAILALIDPALTRAERDRETVVVLQGSAADRTLASTVASVLQSTFEVSREAIPHAAAYVVAGADLPEGWRPPAEARIFTVIPAAPGLGLKILQLTAPSEVALDSIAPLEADVQVDGTGDRDLVVTLIVDGVRMIQTPRRITGDETRVRVPMAFVPSQAGLVRLRVEMSMLDREPAVADRVIQVTERVWNVLAFDGRPTYSSTFVRRALESDPRFKVSTRVVTSRASAIETNLAPSTLTNASALSRFDLVVVGASDTLGESEAAALQQYLRERHGAVILLPETTQDTLLARLTGQGTWQDDRRIEPASVSPVTPAGPVANEAWAASEFLWPARLPALTTPLATVSHASKGSAPRPAVWQMPVGGGRLAVSSAIDGWRSRAGTTSGFSAFWRTTAGALAQATPLVMDVTLRQRLLMPGQWAQLSVASYSTGDPIAKVSGPSGDASLRLWAEDTPDGTGREWSGAFRAPDQPGRYRVNVTDNAGGSAVADFIVVAPDGADTPIAPVQERNGLSALAATAHQGRVVPADQLNALPAQISAALPSATARETWHPMRSVWWLMPFTLCAAGEWWLRRHRGER